MDLEVCPKETEAIAPGPILPQTAYWARLKEKHGYRSQAFDIKSELSNKNILKWKNHQNIFDDLLVVLRYINQDSCIAYVPYGPTSEPREEIRGPLLEELSESLRPYLPDQCFMIRYDLPWQSPFTGEDDYYDEHGHWMGAPEARIQEMRMNFDTLNWNLQKAPSDVLPAHTIFLNLQNKKNDLLDQMKPKTRYNIRLSGRKGIEVKTANKEDLKDWYKIYCETTTRNRIIKDDLAYFDSVINTQANETSSPVNPMLLLAKYEEIPLAGMVLTISGGRATYLYGASSSRYRNKMASYALQWEAIKLAKNAGCREYDLFGISERPDPSHPMYGLYRFKSGFGGEFFHRQGCWDYPFNQEKYNNYRMYEMKQQGYHN